METDSEAGLEEEVPEAEDDQEITDGEESSDEEVGNAEAAVTLKSKNGNFLIVKIIQKLYFLKLKFKMYKLRSISQTGHK